MSDEAVPGLLGHDSERLIAATGWIGEHPIDRSDVAHLLIYPAGHGVAAKMRAVAEAMGLAPALAGPIRTTDTIDAAIDPDGPHVQLRNQADELVLERPVTTEWAAVAVHRGYAVVTVGQDGYTGRPADLDSYVSRGQRLHLGLVRLRPAR